jgi:mono/diheme cytochrome c family protein
MPRVLDFSRRFFSRAARRKWFALLLPLFCSGLLGWGLAQLALSQILPAQPPPSGPSFTPTETVDVVPERYQLGQQLYLENCAGCHVGLPPAVLPSQTWAGLLQEPQHYGATIKPLVEPQLKIAWKYVSTYSRPIDKNEPVPYQVRKSRYFKALHPKVNFTTPPSVNSCITCHPAAAQFNYRRLSPEWENAS